MAAGRLLLPGWMPALDGNGDPIPNAKVYFYYNKTSTLAPVYADEALSLQIANPVEANATGRFPAVWADGEILYSAAVEAPYGPDGVPFTYDNLSASLAAEIVLTEAAEAAADDAEVAYQAILDAIQAAQDADGDAALAGAVAGQAAAQDVLNGKADTDLGNADVTEARSNLGLTDTDITNITRSPIVLEVEDFYESGDGDDWAPAFARLETHRQSLAPYGRAALVRLRRAVYGVSETVEFEVSPWNSLFAEGGGYLLDGTRIEPLPTWAGGEGVPVVRIKGADGFNTIAQFSVKNLAVVQAEGGAGPADVAVEFVDLGASAGGNLAEDIYTQGFRVPFQFTNARIIEMNRCYGWSRNIDDACGVRIVADGAGSFTGDLTFERCQFVVGKHGPSGPIYELNGSSIVKMEATNGGDLRGVRFNSLIGYHADTPIDIVAGPGSIVADWWFNPGCQFDQTVGRWWSVKTETDGDGSHGTIYTGHVRGVYFSTIPGAHVSSLMQGTRGDPDQINANSGNVADIHIVGCMLPNFSENVFFEKCVGLHFYGNDLYGAGDDGGTLDALVVLLNCHDVDMNGNIARATVGNIDYAVVVAGGSNISVGPWLGDVAAIRDWEGKVVTRVEGKLMLPALPGPYANDAAAVSAGLVSGQAYKVATSGGITAMAVVP